MYRFQEINDRSYIHEQSFKMINGDLDQTKTFTIKILNGFANLSFQSMQTTTHSGLALAVLNVANHIQPLFLTYLQ